MSDERVGLFKQIMGSYPTGVTIVTTVGANGEPVGLTVNSFTSVSLEPLLVLWCVDKRFSALDAFLSSDKFAVHILAEDQGDACWAFAGKAPDRFAKVEWRFSNQHLPVISGSLGVFECKKTHQIEAGDHFVLIGEVVDIQKNEKEPLLYFRRHVGAVPAGWPN